MISLLRRKRQTTPSRTTWPGTAVTKLLALAGCCFLGQTLCAQTPSEDKPKSLASFNLKPPGKEQLFQIVESEISLFERWKQEKKQIAADDKFELPKENVAKIEYKPRNFMPSNVFSTPHLLVHNPLYFHQINPERYGWEWGIFQPAISTGQFYADIVLLPYKLAVNKPWSCDNNAGYFLPGDCVPYYAYTPTFSWKGVFAEASAAVAGAAIFP